mmetsp:Transcript_10945/g.22924  ORF Transcript_10945/g.22924 Transcript_10945/m.22924 type:complete len:206 (-) Transcript_10945:301-918(-)
MTSRPLVAKAEITMIITLCLGRTVATATCSQCLGLVAEAEISNQCWGLTVAAVTCSQCLVRTVVVVTSSPCSFKVEVVTSSQCSIKAAVVVLAAVVPELVLVIAISNQCPIAAAQETICCSSKVEGVISNLCFAKTILVTRNSCFVNFSQVNAKVVFRIKLMINSLPIISSASSLSNRFSSCSSSSSINSVIKAVLAKASPFTRI